MTATTAAQAGQADAELAGADDGRSELSGVTLPGLLLGRAVRTPQHVALRKKDLGRWKEYTWADYATRAARVGLGLRALEIGPGDRVAIQAGNRPAWLLTDLGTQGIGAITVGIHPASPPAEVEHVLRHSGAKVLIAEDEEQVDKAMAVRDACPDLGHIVVVDPRGLRVLDEPPPARSHPAAGSAVDPQGMPAAPAADRLVLSTFADLEQLGASGELADFERSVRSLDPDQPAIIVYTSSPTGPPKGAMLSHRNLLTAASSGRQLFTTTDRDEVLSYLPLSHVGERLISVIGALSSGYVVNFGGGADELANDLRIVQPTFFLGTPQVWETLRAGVEVRMQDASRLKRKIFARGITRGRRLAARRLENRRTLADRIWSAVWWVLLFRPLRDKLGLRRVRLAVSGAAPIAPHVLEWFWAVGVAVVEAYGQAENTAQATATRVGAVRIGTVGQPVPEADVLIAGDGEILTRGPGTFLGYFRDREATAEVIDDEGWLHTGDVGELDADGFLTITDRKKDIIITASGQNVSPSEIENKLEVSPYVREAIVVGDRRSYLTALVGIEKDTVGEWAARQQITYATYEDLAGRPEVRELVSEWIDEVNADLAPVEQIRAFALLPKELDHEDGGATATQKVKRRVIAGSFGDLIAELYGDGGNDGATQGGGGGS